MSRDDLKIRSILSHDDWPRLPLVPRLESRPTGPCLVTPLGEHICPGNPGYTMANASGQCVTADPIKPHH